MGQAVLNNGDTKIAFRQAINANFSELYSAQVARAEWFGVPKDGTDALATTLAINSALVAAKAAGATDFILGDGTYLINATGYTNDPNDYQYSLRMQDGLNFRMTPNCILRVKPSSSPDYAVIQISRNNAYASPIGNLTIEGGQIVGDRDMHTYAQTGYHDTHEFGYGIQLGHSVNVTIRNVRIKNMTGDGIALDGFRDSSGSPGVDRSNVNTVIENCIIDNNRRQGISVIAGNGTIIRNNIIKNTNGVNPQFGIDIEGYGYIHDILIEGNVFSGNAEGDISNYNGKGVTIRKNIFSSKYGISNVTGYNLTVEDNLFQGYITRRHNTIVEVGDTVKWETGRTFWTCTTMGKTAATTPDIAGKGVNDTVADGAAVWTMTATAPPSDTWYAINFNQNLFTSLAPGRFTRIVRNTFVGYGRGVAINDIDKVYWQHNTLEDQVTEGFCARFIGTLYCDHNTYINSSAVYGTTSDTLPQMAGYASDETFIGKGFSAVSGSISYSRFRLKNAGMSASVHANVSKKLFVDFIIDLGAEAQTKTISIAGASNYDMRGGQIFGTVTDVGGTNGWLINDNLAGGMAFDAVTINLTGSPKFINIAGPLTFRNCNISVQVDSNQSPFWGNGAQKFTWANNIFTNIGSYTVGIGSHVSIGGNRYSEYEGNIFTNFNLLTLAGNLERDNMGNNLRSIQFSAAVPTERVWLAGTVIKASAPAVGQPRGWVVTTSGGAYSTTRADDTALTAGTWAAWPTGATVWECTTSGTTTTSAPDIAGKVVGDTVVDGTVTWTMRSTTKAVFTSDGNL